jgi:hypothetical protein
MGVPGTGAEGPLLLLHEPQFLPTSPLSHSDPLPASGRNLACVVIRSFTTVAIIKDGHARIIIMRPETILH